MASAYSTPKFFQTNSNVFVQLSNSNCKIISLACPISFNSRYIFFPLNDTCSKIFFQALTDFVFFSCRFFQGRLKGAPLSERPL